MKKISFFILALFVSAVGFSQSAKFGIKGGVNIARLGIEPDPGGIDSKVGYHAGLLSHIHLSRQWALQPELTYSLQGMNQTVGGTRYPYNLGYLNIPVLVQYMFDNGFRLEAGPQLGLLLAAKQKGGGTTTDIRDNFKSTDISLGFGLGYLTKSGFGLDGRYNLGLSKINSSSTGNEVKNRVIQLGIFYMFDNRHKVKSR
jgi:hypothetical protein